MTIHSIYAAEPAGPVTPASPASPAEPARASAGAWYALALLVLATVLGAVDKIALTLLAEPLRQALNLSDTQLGLLQGVGVTLFAGLATLPLGWLSDRFDRRLVLAACVLFWSAATALRGTAQDFSILFIASIGLGVGDAGLGPITYSLIPDLFPRAQRALANMLFTMASLFGAALGAMLGGGLVALTDHMRPLLPAALQAYETWRLVFFGLAALGPVLVVLLLLMRRPPAPAAAQAATAGAPAAAGISFACYLRTHWRTLSGLVCGLGLASVGLSAIGAWVPLIVARQFGTTPAELGQGLGLAFLGGMLVGALLGNPVLSLARRRLGDTTGGVRVVTLGNLLTGLLSVLLLFARSSNEMFVVMALLVMPLICGAIVMPNLLQDISPAHLRARVISALTVASLVFAVLSPLLVGSLSDALKSLPNGLAYALVAITLLTTGGGALVLHATEPSLVRLSRAMRSAS